MAYYVAVAGGAGKNKMLHSGDMRSCAKYLLECEKQGIAPKSDYEIRSFTKKTVRKVSAEIDDGVVHAFFSVEQEAGADLV